MISYSFEESNHIITCLECTGYLIWVQDMITIDGTPYIVCKVCGFESRYRTCGFDERCDNCGSSWTHAWAEIDVNIE